MGRKCSGLVILLLLLTLKVGAVDFEYTFNNTTLVLGERVQLRITFPHDKASEILSYAPETPDGFRYYYGPDKRPRNLYNEDGELERYVQIVYEYRTSQKGIVNLGAFEFGIRGEEKRYFTQPEEFIILARDESHLNFPVDISWHYPQGPYYENQAIPVTLLVDGAGEIAFPRAIEVTPPRGTVFQEIPAYLPIDSRRTRREEVYTVPAATYMMSPTRPGDILLNRGYVTIFGVDRQTLREVLSVRPLPGGVSTSRAIGDFQWTYNLEKGEIPLGQEIVLTITLEGAGNLYGLTPPEVETDLPYLGTQEDLDTQVTSEGYQGHRIFTYRYLAESPGEHALLIPSYPVLNPKTAQIYNLSGGRIPLTILPAADSSEEVQPQWSLIPKDELPVYQVSRMYANPFQHLWVLPGVFLFVILAFTKKRGKSVMTIALVLLISSGRPVSFSDSAAAYEAWEQGNFSQAAQDFSALAQERENAGLLYNAGLSYLAGGENGEGLNALRQAIRLKPLNQDFRQTLEEWELYLGFDSSINPAFIIHGNISYLTLILSGNLVLLFAGLFLRYKKGREMVLALLFGLIGLTASAGLVYTLWYNSSPQGLVMTDQAPIVKIPDKQANDWMTLAEGTSFRVEGETEDYILVVTSYGLEGWLTKDKVRILE